MRMRMGSTVMFALPVGFYLLDLHRVEYWLQQPKTEWHAKIGSSAIIPTIKNHF